MDGDEQRVDALLASLGLAGPPGPAGALDDRRAEEAGQRRSRRRWLLQLAAESATMAGVLLTLAEQEDPVTIHCGPWVHHGRLRRVTEPLTIIESHEGVILVPTAAVTVVESATAVADDRTLPTGPDLTAALVALAPQHPAVRLQLVDGTETRGRLLDLGKDLVRVQQASTTAAARLEALAGCVVLTPGGFAGEEAGPGQGA